VILPASADRTLSGAKNRPMKKTPCRAYARDFRTDLKDLGADLASVRATLVAKLRAARKEASTRLESLDAAMQRKVKGERLRCGARCRDGHSCEAQPYWPQGAPVVRNGRCRMHGGLSTGPRTARGKARVAEAARRTLLQRRALGNDCTRSSGGGP
jgi:hypothetical protein